MSDKVWTHRGDAGDLLAALPVMASLGGGKLYLQRHDCTGNRMTPERVESLRPLLECQPYIHGVEWTEQMVGEYLDAGVRHSYQNGLNLSDMQASPFGVPHWPREQPWLVVPRANRVAKVIFSRTPRYRNWSFNWKRIWEEYHLDAVFCGAPEEHADFVQGVGPVAYYHTKDYLELASVIAGAALVCVNQTSIFWLAEGLKMPVLLEACAYCQNCHFDRYGMIYGTNEHHHLPKVEELTDRWAHNMARRAEGHTVVTEDRLRVIARCVRETERLPGDMAELGTYKGGTAKVISSVCPQKKLHLFDTFQGIPEDDVLEGGHKRGEFAAGLDEVQTYLSGHNVEYHVGTFPETAAGLEDLRISFAHLDLDTYQSTKAAIEYVWPRLVSGGVMVLDDVDWVGCPGVSLALQEAGLYEKVERLAAQQGVVRKP